jgi:hypothetical protein
MEVEAADFDFDDEHGDELNFMLHAFHFTETASTYIR